MDERKPPPIPDDVAWTIEVRRAALDDQWKSMETAPKDGTRVLLGFARSHSEEGYWMDDPKRNHWGEVGWFGCEDDVLCDHPSDPDAWMPMPEPPSAAAIRRMKGEQP